MPFPARDLLRRLRAEAAAAAQTLLDFATPPLVLAVAGNAAPCPADTGPTRGTLLVPAPALDPDKAAILADIRALTEELDRQNRRAVPVTGTHRPNGPFGAAVAAGCLWLEG